MTYYGWRQILNIPNTLRVVSACWSEAEKNLQADIRENYPDSDEEFITELFHGKLASKLRSASNERYIEQAFLADLQAAFPSVGYELHEVAQGLVADVTLHKRSTESTTGGDLGFMIIRPNVRDHGYMLEINGYRRGILCQAKLRRRTGQWGDFTARQREVLPQRLAYLALLLYSYEDLSRRRLQQFRWHLCNSASFEELVRWLKEDSFQNLQSSDVIIRKLGNGAIGTSDDLDFGQRELAWFAPSGLKYFDN